MFQKIILIFLEITKYGRGKGMGYGWNKTELIIVEAEW